MKKITAWLSALMLATLTLGMQACIDERMTPPDGDNADKNTYVTLTLNVPYGERSTATRAATDVVKREKAIKNVSILVFQRQTDDTTGKTTDILAYEATTTDLVTDGDGNCTTIVRLFKSLHNEEYNLLVIANLGSHIAEQYIGKSKAYIQQQLMFDYAGAWSATDGTPDAFPMSGESFFGKIGDKSYLSQARTIPMLRSLARMDVGLAFTPAASGDLNSEEFAGIAGWTLESVHLYRTRNKGVVIPPDSAYASATHDKVDKPSVPGDAALNNPGTLGTTDGGRLYTPNLVGKAAVHAIYVPENSAAVTDDATAVVAGIKALSSGKVYYYRLDLGNNHTTLAPILRNYRYIFNITAINGQGMDTPDEALHALRTDLTYTVLSWDESAPSNLWVSGSYFFRVDKREVELPARKLDSYDAPDYQLTYETNLPLDSIRWKWDSDNPPVSYTVLKETPAGTAFKHNTGVLQFAANGNNNGTADLTANLAFTAGDIKGTIRVSQRFIPMDYRIDCATGVVVKGVFYVGDKPGDDLPTYSSTHYIELTLTNISAGMVGERWKIRTVPYTQADDDNGNGNLNGLAFQGEGTFENLGRQRIRLDIVPGSYGAALTPAQKLRYKLVVNSTAYGTDSIACEDLNVAIALHKKKILGIGWNGRSGYGYYAESGVSRAFLESDLFSLHGAKGMPVDGIVFDCDNTYSDAIADNLIKKVKTNPDIILASNLMFDATTASKRLAAALVEYVNNKGVLFVYNGTERVPGASMEPCWDNKVTFSNQPWDVTAKSGGRMRINYYKYNPLDNGTVNDALLAKLIVPDDDPIYCGKLDGVQYFPSLDTIQGGAWLGNATLTYNTALPAESEQLAYFKESDVNSAPYDDFVIYSYERNSKTYPRYKYFCFMRYKPKNLVYVGDGGWFGGFSKEAEDTGGTGDTYEKSEASDYDTPFAVSWKETDDGWVPTWPKTKVFRGDGNATLGGKGDIHNSFLFANCMTWALYQAEFNGINSQP